MDASRSSTPDPPQDLWSSILDSVSSSRSIPSKQVIVLGEPSTGKSTITSALLARPVEDSNAEIRDFAIGYEYADVRDDEGMNSLHISTHKVDKKKPLHLRWQIHLCECLYTRYHHRTNRTYHYYRIFSHHARRCRTLRL